MKSAAALLSVLLLAAVSAAQQPAGTHAAVQGKTAQFQTAPQQSFGVAGMENLGSKSQQSAPTPLTQEQLKARALQWRQAMFGQISTCPVSMDARQGGGLRILRARKDGKPLQPGMTPTLNLRDPAGKHIASASITAYGYSAPKGATPLQTTEGQPPDFDNSLTLNAVRHPAGRRLLTRTLTIRFQPEDGGGDSSEFHLPGFVTVTSIRLNSVTYADGSIWNVGSKNSCRTTMSPLMLVGGN